MIKNEFGRLEMHPLPPVHKAKVVLIGEYPNMEELRKGQYFISDGAETLRATLTKCGFKLEDCYFTVTALYLMNKKNKSLPEARFNKERARLIEEIQQTGAKLVIPLGTFASGTLLKNKNITMKKILGNVLDIPELPDVKIIPNYHPAALIHAPGNYKVFHNIMVTAHKWYAGDGVDPGVTTWEWAETEQSIRALISMCNKRPYVSADIEASSLDTKTNLIWVIGVCGEKNKVTVISREAVLQFPMLVAELLSTSCRWIWHHGKFDTELLHWKGFTQARLDEDTIYLDYALNETNGSHGLGTIATIRLGADEYKSEMNSEFAYITTVEAYQQYKQQLGKRVAIDADYTFQIYEILRPEVKSKPGPENVYNELLMPAANFLRKVQMRGIKVDVPYLESRVPVYEAKIDAQVKEIQEHAAQYWDPEIYKAQTQAKSASAEFKPTSVKQLAWLIYDKLRLKPKHKDAKKRGTGAEVLETIENAPQFILDILDLRKIKKEYSTYVKAYLEMKDDNDLLHTTFNLHVTATGRLSSVEPNVQNVPSHKPDIRNSLIPRAKNRILMEVDYSGAELRVLAWVSGDKNLTRALVEGDPHGEVAEQIFGDAYTNGDDKARKNLRGIAKTINFGIAYGRQAPNIAETFNVSLAEAQRYIDVWAATYPEAWKYLQSCEAAVRSGEVLETPYGRQRRFGLINNINVQDLINEAKNFRIQSISSDNTLLAGMSMDETLETQYDTFIVNLIHDSLLLDCPANPKIVKAVAQLATKTMIDWPVKRFGCTVPFKSDVDLGPSWGTFTAYDIETETVTINKEVIPYVDWISTFGIITD